MTILTVAPNLTVRISSRQRTVNFNLIITLIIG